MGILEIIGGIVILLSSIIIIIATIFQSPKQQDLGSALSGSSGDDGYYGKDKGSSREEALASLTRILAIVLFVGTLAVNIIVALKS